jgi:fructose-1,6-bisphosphatase/inositol monophosphatase family enzyme
MMEMTRSSNRGGQFVNDHADASIQADLETEAAILRVLEDRNVSGVFLSEEYLKDGERPELRPSGPALDGGRRVYVVADPLDGSAIYAHNLPLWWYACVGVYGEDGAALAGCIVDVPRRVLYACDDATAYRADLDERANPTRWSVLKAPEEKAALSDCWLEIYILKPKYLGIAADRYQNLTEKFWAIVPNGGPGGFTDCADGLADVYFHYGLPDTEHLSGGLMIAERAGCVVTDLQGNRVEFDPALEQRPDILCSTGPRLHAQALELLPSPA